MPTSKVVVSIDRRLLAELDNLVAEKVFASRSQAIQRAVEEELVRIRRSRLARECSKFDPDHERAIAEEGISGELAQWTEYREP